MKYPLLGSHVSVNNSNEYGPYLIGAARQSIEDNGNTFMIFTGPPQSSVRKSTSEMFIKEMHDILTENNIDLNNLVVHAPYIINISNPVVESVWQFGVDFLAKEIKRCEDIGINILVLHPGAFTKGTVQAALEKLIEGLNIVTKNPSPVKIALETMSGKGTEVGITIDQLAYVINKLDNPNRVGICVDTCHMNDAGYDLQNWISIKKDINQLLGLDKVLVFHINDSNFPIGSHRDRHANIGYGTIGFNILSTIVWDEDFKDIPKILETPYVENESPYKIEIRDFRNKSFSNELDIIKGD